MGLRVADHFDPYVKLKYIDREFDKMHNFVYLYFKADENEGAYLRAQSHLNRVNDLLEEMRQKLNFSNKLYGRIREENSNENGICSR